MASKDGEKKENDQMFPGYNTIDELTQAGYKALVDATRKSNFLPTGPEWDYYCSYSPSFQRTADAEGTRILELISMVLRHQGVKGSILRRDKDEKFELVVEGNDTILERVGCNLDEMSGIHRNPGPTFAESTSTRAVSGSWNSSPAPFKQDQRAQINTQFISSKNIQRPQIKFMDTVDNSSTPFVPRIKDKPNALKPLAILVEMEDGEECYSHPYHYELDLLKIPKSQLERVEPQMYKPLNKTPLIIIQKPEDLPALLEDLNKYTEIAVDLEHHSYRSFQGFTCLMQISTRDTDYLIDTIELRKELHCLNEVFTKPSIVKVFHGADLDIVWLQRDFSLYVVNMFDTHQASRVLNFTKLSLAFLLNHYCNVTAQKQYQLADWRVRPLPNELKLYAREDTHYLLYIYDIMKNALLTAANGEQTKLMAVIERSRDVCKKRYKKPILQDNCHVGLFHSRHSPKKLFDNRQTFALEKLYQWRDQLARQEDESTGYILPNNMMMHIAETLPREMQGILACCNPIPPLVRQNLTHLHQIVLRAREQPLIKPLFKEEARMRPPAQTWLKAHLEGALHCPHDLSHLQDFRDDLPTLINADNSQTIIEHTKKKAKKKQRTENPVDQLMKKKPSVSLFEEIDFPTHCDIDTEASTEKAKQVLFVCPYERYRRVRPFVDAQETEEADEDVKSEIQGEVKSEGTPEACISPYARNTNRNGCQLKRPASAEQSKPIASEVLEQTSSNLVYDVSDAEQNTKNEQPLRKKQKKRKRKCEKDSTAPEHSPAKQPKVEGNPTADTSDSAFLEQSKPARKKNKKGNKSKQDFQPLDYSKVNFERFQGGSKKIPQNKQQKYGNFRPKGKKGKSFGKMNKKLLSGW